MIGKYRVPQRKGTYKLVFTANGSSLTGSLYDDTNRNSPVLLRSISTTDSTYASGSPGLIVFEDTDTSQRSLGADVTFDNFSVVPEPGAMGIIVGAGVGLFIRRQR